MSKKWCQREAMTGLSVTPEQVNDEIRAQQSSITTLDRTQMPANFLNPTRLKDYALHQVWESSDFPSGGEQTAEQDTGVPDNSFMCSTVQVMAGGWRDIGASALSLTGFKGNNLLIEWSFNAYVNNQWCQGIHDGRPYSPNYMRARILVNGITLVERRGAGYHQHIRLVGAENFPPGDLKVQFQYQITPPSEDAASVTKSGNNVPYGHIWNSRYLAIARYR